MIVVVVECDFGDGVRPRRPGLVLQRVQPRAVSARGEKFRSRRMRAPPRGGDGRVRRGREHPRAGGHVPNAKRPVRVRPRGQQERAFRGELKRHDASARSRVDELPQARPRGRVPHANHALAGPLRVESSDVRSRRRRDPPRLRVVRECGDRERVAAEERLLTLAPDSLDDDVATGGEERRSEFGDVDRGRRGGGGGDRGGALGGLVPGGGGARGESDDARGADRDRFLPGRRSRPGPLRDFLGPGVDGLDGRLRSVLVRDWNIRVDVFGVELVLVVDGGFLDARVLAAAAAVLAVRL
mmetsp:Transcript_7888/g.32483  ORF Transcript_7888/g.32483 Transcript_7888/m.32483 type:complete len:298 (+) Transcript_7888:1677-2570(+)